MNCRSIGLRKAGGVKQTGVKAVMRRAEIFPVIPGRCEALNCDVQLQIGDVEIPGLVLRTIPE